KKSYDKFGFRQTELPYSIEGDIELVSMLLTNQSLIQNYYKKRNFIKKITFFGNLDQLDEKAENHSVGYTHSLACFFISL
ncbi:TPA: hypothetical protein JBB87_04880, partial [Legionella pneumophila subsp. pneumophila]|nr:hypothetical protein [Legionella pneumophila subsp. pneumophila]